MILAKSRATRMSERVCLNCRSDISHRDARAKYCSKKCLNAPRFYGTYCDWCKKELFVARGNLKLTRFCSKRCVFLFKHPNLNENYFAEPNLENSYWAGLIAADGCIYSRDNNWQKVMSLAHQESPRLNPTVQYTVLNFRVTTRLKLEIHSGASTSHS